MSRETNGYWQLEIKIIEGTNGISEPKLDLELYRLYGISLI